MLRAKRGIIFFNSNHVALRGRYVEGGMGSVSSAISQAAKEAGSLVVTSAEVSHETESMPGVPSYCIALGCWDCKTALVCIKELILDSDKWSGQNFFNKCLKR